MPSFPSIIYFLCAASHIQTVESSLTASKWDPCGLNSTMRTVQFPLSGAVPDVDKLQKYFWLGSHPLSSPPTSPIVHIFTSPTWFPKARRWWCGAGERSNRMYQLLQLSNLNSRRNIINDGTLFVEYTVPLSSSSFVRTGFQSTTLLLTDFDKTRSPTNCTQSARSSSKQQWVVTLDSASSRPDHLPT